MTCKTGNISIKIHQQHSNFQNKVSFRLLKKFGGIIELFLKKIKDFTSLKEDAAAATSDGYLGNLVPLE